MITAPGIYDLPADAYHADPCPEPSLSNSIGKLLIRRSPMHAWSAHPRLNPGAEGKDATAAMDAGTILHRLLLGKGEDYEPIAADNWTTKAAREARNAARAAGRVPVLERQLHELEQAAEAAAMQMRSHPDCQDFYSNGQSEAVMAWREGVTWCRAMVDRLSDAGAIFDLKTTGTTAAPEEWERTLVKDYAFQAAFYLRGARTLGLRVRAFRFVVIEQKRPFGVAVFACAPSLLALADAEVGRALALWGECRRSGHWPGYAPYTAHVEAPAWMLNRADERDLRDEIMREYAA